jgi:hypothetical protein
MWCVMCDVLICDVILWCVMCDMLMCLMYDNVWVCDVIWCMICDVSVYVIMLELMWCMCVMWLDMAICDVAMCLMCDVWCVMCDVMWCVMCLMCDVWCVMCDVWCVMWCEWMLAVGADVDVRSGSAYILLCAAVSLLVWQKCTVEPLWRLCTCDMLFVRSSRVRTNP